MNAGSDSIRPSGPARPSQSWTASPQRSSSAARHRSTQRVGVSQADAATHPLAPWVRPSNASPSAPTKTSTPSPSRSEEHTSELQSRGHLVCRLLLEKKNTQGGSRLED